MKEFRDGSPNPERRVLGGVLANGPIEREITINLVALRTIHGADEGETKKIRQYLLALTLIAATADLDLSLREGCHLRYVADGIWRAIPRRGDLIDVDLSSEAAQDELLKYAKEVVEPFKAKWPEELKHKFDLKEAKKLLAKQTEEEQSEA